MAFLNVRVIDGLERGRVYLDLPTPVSVGREEDNTIQLNDDRVSRFHAKLQDDQGHVILTDLDSTNGTRVNGHPVQIHVLRTGDIISIGRCLLLYENVTDKQGEFSQTDSSDTQFHLPENAATADDSGELEFFDPPTPNGDERIPLFAAGRPVLPERLSALQRARTTDLVAYFHERFSELLADSVILPGDPQALNEQVLIRCDRAVWCRFTDLAADLAAYLKELGDPETSQ